MNEINVSSICDGRGRGTSLLTKDPGKVFFPKTGHSVECALDKKYIGSPSDRLVKQDEYKSKKIECISDEIKRTFPLPGFDECHYNRHYNSTYYFCNEFSDNSDDIHSRYSFNFKKVIDEIKNRHPAVKDKETGNNINVAFVVGESCLLSAIPEIVKQCDMVLMVDHNEKLLNVQCKRLESIKNCKDIQEEGGFYESLDVDFNMDDSSSKAMYIQGLGCYYPFHSNDRLLEVREAIEKAKIFPVYCDLFKRDDVFRLSKILSDNHAKVNLINLSNAMEYYEGFIQHNGFSFANGRPVTYQHLQNCLPFSKNTLCVFSTIWAPVRQVRICSVDSYWREIDEVNSAPHSFESSFLENFKRVINFELQMHHIDPPTNGFRYYPQQRMLLAHANSSQIKEISGSLSEFEQTFECVQEIPYEYKEKIKGWIKEAIEYWEQQENRRTGEQENRRTGEQENRRTGEQENREQRTENREQRTENREQRTENREQRTENREQRTENREQRTDRELRTPLRL